MVTNLAVKLDQYWALCLEVDWAFCSETLMVADLVLKFATIVLESGKYIPSNSELREIIAASASLISDEDED